ncbi:MAG TPA: hypothetical protein VHE30_28520 [Polyangiaceae bacterium]|nr:hypothetical protein [Polyangiaceae bacterium]
MGESVGGGLPGCYCSYRCLNDGECGPGQICQCDALGGTCVDAKCTTDSECSDGNLCTSVVASPGCGGVRFACQTSLDECLSDADCPSGRQCALNDTPGVPGSGTAHVCMAPTCAIGRPFLVNGAPRLAPCVERDDFRSALLPAVETLDESARETLRLRWTEIALMEHASVAAFARFLQDLFSFGAPAELVERTVAAMGDETRHAKDAFALASAYAGKGLGPGVLDAADDRPRSRREVVVTTILEGCIGETVAAVEAAEALARAADPAVRTALARVAQEESRHAELAWKFVSWVLSSGDSELAAETRSALLDVARGALRDAGKARGPVSANADGEVLAAHGILDDALRAEIRARALSELFVPCAMALVRVHDERLPRAA